MADEQMRRNDPDVSGRKPGEACEADCNPGADAGPPREGGGTTGAGNLAEGGASRTGGATGGTPRPSSAVPTNDVPPSA